MNVFDIIVCIIAVAAVINGWRRGFAVQVVGLAAIIIGIIVAVNTCALAGAKLGIDPRYASAVGFLVVFLAVAAVLLLLGRLIRRIFKFAGLGILDVLLGIVLSLLKVAIVLGILCTIFDKINEGAHFVPRETLDRSITYRPLCNMVSSVGLWGRIAADTTEKAVESTLEII